MSMSLASDLTRQPHAARPVSLLWAVLFALAVCALTPLPFLPALANDFVNWDDPGLILNNAHIQTLGWEQLRWVFTSFHMGPYEPLPLLSLGLDYALWGPNPRGFHLSSLLWHTVNALSFYWVARRLLLAAVPQAAQRPLLLGLCSALSAIVFSMHPLRVETVAWAAGRLDVVAACFGLWTVWAYLNVAQPDLRRTPLTAPPLPPEGPLNSFNRDPQGSALNVSLVPAAPALPSGSRLNECPPRKLWLSLSLFFYVLSLLSKPSTLLLPAVLSVIDFYPLGRLTGSRWRISDPQARRIWMEKLPFWILSFIAVAVGLYGRSVAGSLAPLTAYGPIDRIALAGFSFGFCVWKTVLPVRLSPLYELPDEISIGEPRFLMGIGATILVTILLVRYRRHAYAALAAWAVYLILLLPVSGLAQTGAQLAADRYSYLPCLSLAVLLGGLLLRWSLTIGFARAVGGLATLLIACSLILGGLSRRQTRVWHDSQTLWRYALTIDPSSTKALTSLACAIADEGELAPARELLEKAIQSRPRSYYAHWNLGLVLRRLGEDDLAIRHYLEAWKWSPRSFEVASTLGSLYQEKRDWANAALWHGRALSLRPNWPSTLRDLGTVRIALGELDRAVVLLERAIQIDPDNAGTHNSLGIALRRLGKTDLATEQFLIASRLDPDSADICYNLGYLFMQAEDWQSAVEWYERALAIDPMMTKALNDMGIVCKKRGEIERAMELYRKALQVDSSSTEPRYNLALALADQAQDEAAIAEYTRVLELDSTHVSAASNLAALLVRRQNFSQAAQILAAAVRTTNHPGLVQRLSWLLATAPDAAVRDGPQAVRLAEYLAQRTESNPQILDTLAAAYAETGQFARAVDTASRAIRVASQQDMSDFADEIAARRDLYGAGQAFRSK